MRPGNPLLSPQITSCRREPFPPSGAMAKGCQMLSPADASHSACAGDILSVLRKQERQQTGHRLAPGCGGLLADGCSSATAREKGCSSREILVVRSGAQLQSQAVTSTVPCPWDAGHGWPLPTAAALLHFLFSALTLPSQVQPVSHMCLRHHWKMHATYMQSSASVSLSFNE